MSRMIIKGTGSALPARVLTNHDLARMVDTSDEWITTRTGIKTRRIAGKGEETSKLAAMAARKALVMAEISAVELDLILVATITPDMSMPSAACLVQAELGAEKAFAFDLNAACSGFLYGLDVADKYIRSGADKKILVIGAENLSSRVDWEDRNTCVLFGDGAGACVLAGGTDEGRGYLASRLYADGSLAELLYMEAAPSRNPDLKKPDYDGCYIKMAGREIFKHAVRCMENAVNQLLEEENVAIADIDLIIPHQANIRILQSLADHLGVGPEKIYINVHKYGNTSAATIPIALDEAYREGRIRQGDLLLLCSFGAGFTWGASLIRL